jgi:hypothetical protein
MRLLPKLGGAIEGYLDTILFNLVAGTILKRQISKLLRWMQDMDHSKWNNNILYADRS